MSRRVARTEHLEVAVGEPPLAFKRRDRGRWVEHRVAAYGRVGSSRIRATWRIRSQRRPRRQAGFAPLATVSHVGTFILTWNPIVFPEAVDWLDASAGTASPDLPIPADWSVGGRRGGIVPGDTALLLRQHHDRGVVASGAFTSGVYQEEHWDGSERLANNADVDFHYIVTVEERLPIELLKAGVSEINWDRLQGSGVRVPENVEPKLLDLWNDHIKGAADGPIYPGDENPTFFEGGLRTVKVNRYERNRQAREACLKHYGSVCAVCGFDFESVYGIKEGRGIHVHHLRELSDIGVGYHVDPIEDLVPVCPNCHAAFHSRKPAYSLPEVRALLKPRMAAP
jgi:5-methylcytosine-specific restriction protein A